MKSCLILGFVDRMVSISFLEKIKNIEMFIIKKKEDDILFEQNVEIISSERAGIGKSTYIKEKINKYAKKYNYFPLGGEFNRKDIINRLKNIKIRNKDSNKVVIHLDLYDSKQNSLIKEVLYCFLITKSFWNKDTLFYLSKEIEIKIEIQNSFFDSFQKYPILNMFKNKYFIKKDKISPLKNFHKN